VFFFVQVAGCGDGDAKAFESTRKIVAKVGRVRDKGRGTVEDPLAGWFEVASSACSSTLAVRDTLQSLGIRLQKVIEIDKGEGKLQAKQFSLFGGV
jgi:hypothetical protein